MKQTITFNLFIFLLCVGSFSTSAQEFSGYQTSNYTGVNGVFFNPANIADSRYRWDVNLVGVNALFGNNHFAAGTDVDIDKLVDNLFLEAKGNVDAILAATINGPSVMFNIKKRNSVAIFSRSHVLVNFDNLNSNLFQQFTGDEVQNPSLPFSIASAENMTANVNAYTEFGMAFARVLKNDDKMFLKAGISLKYITGTANGYLRIDNLKATLNNDETLAQPDPYITNATGILSIGMSGVNLSDFDASDLLDFKSTGFGVDLGVVYEYRTEEFTDRRDVNKYKFKIGLALLNVGSIKYTLDKGRSQSYNIHIPNGDRFYFSELDGVSIDEIEKKLDQYPEYFTVNDGGNTSSSYSVSLPTSLQLNADYHIHNGFYANISARVPLTSPNKKAANGRYHSYVSFTPRYENKVVGIFFPMTYNNLTHFSAGAAIRLGPLYVGSGSILSATLGETKKVDVFIGLHFGILHKKPKNEKKGNKN